MFDRFKRKPAARSRLAGLLADYPALTPRHIGSNGAAPLPGQPVLTLEQCRENLDQRCAATPNRLALLGEVLGRLGIDVAAAHDRPDAFVGRAHATLLEELPPLYRPELASHAARECSSRAGPDIALSFMADLALLEEDVLARAKPGCFVGLNLKPGDREMLSWRRPCLLGLVDGLFPHIANIHPVEQDWFGVYGNMDHPARLAAPDRVMPETWGLVIGGTILQRLDRDVVDPKLDEKLRTTWLGEAR